jgi:hypothetical protein
MHKCPPLVVNILKELLNVSFLLFVDLVPDPFAFFFSSLGHNISVLKRSGSGPLIKGGLVLIKHFVIAIEKHCKRFLSFLADVTLTRWLRLTSFHSYCSTIISSMLFLLLIDWLSLFLVAFLVSYRHWIILFADELPCFWCLILDQFSICSLNLYIIVAATVVVIRKWSFSPSSKNNVSN